MIDEGDESRVVFIEKETDPTPRSIDLVVGSYQSSTSAERMIFFFGYAPGTRGGKK